ncbi:translation elongation factor G, putative, partial [Ixodes scapularis]
FPLQVERSLRVLDGAITVLDGSEGVQAQTLSVWEQAHRHSLPRIVFVNKMDKSAADFDACVADIRSKLSSLPLVLQLPVRADDKFAGVVDLASLEILVWPSDSQRGRVFSRTPIAHGTNLHAKALRHRQVLAEAIAEADDLFADEFLLRDKSPTGPELLSAVRRATVAGVAVPVLCGSAYKNTAVQPLLDAVVDFLPGPLVADDRKDRLAALAFKVVHTKFKGPLTFVRLYSGRLTSGQRLYNATRDVSEKAGELVEVTADEYRTVKEASAGDVLAVAGLQHSVTGDLLVNSASSAAAALAGKLAAFSVPADAMSSGTLANLTRRPPVFSILRPARNPAWVGKLDHFVGLICKRFVELGIPWLSPLCVQVLGGLGRLHLEITRDRILREYGVEASLGPLQVAYREAPTNQSTVPVHHVLDRTTGGTKHHVELEMRLVLADGPFRELRVLATEENGLARLWQQHLKALEDGAALALAHGPLHGFPVVNAGVELSWCKVSRGTSVAMVTAAASQCLARALKEAAVVLLEPVMHVEVCTPESYLGRVLNDLSRRRAAIGEVQQRRDVRVVSAKAPLAELDNYADELRTLSSGRASFHMALEEYRPMGTQDTARALRRLAGLADDT